MAIVSNALTPGPKQCNEFVCTNFKLSDAARAVFASPMNLCPASCFFDRSSAVNSCAMISICWLQPEHCLKNNEFVCSDFELPSKQCGEFVCNHFELRAAAVAVFSIAVKSCPVSSSSIWSNAVNWCPVICAPSYGGSSVFENNAFVCNDF